MNEKNENQPVEKNKVKKHSNLNIQNNGKSQTGTKLEEDLLQ